MFLNTKKLAFLGLLLALTVILIIFGGIMETNTLFLLSAASFCVGIAIRESGLRFGFGFYIASILLSIFLAPNKLYCITYAALGLYIVIFEFTHAKLAGFKVGSSRHMIFWIIKYAAFNLMFIPIIILMPKLIYQGEINRVLLTAVFFAGQAALFIYDLAYRYFQKFIWEKFRGKLKL